MFKNQIQLYFIDLNHLLRLIKSSSFNENYFASIGGYTTYVFRSFGYKGLVSKAMIPAVALVAGYKAVDYGLNYGRELLFSRQRS